MKHGVCVFGPEATCVCANSYRKNSFQMFHERTKKRNPTGIGPDKLGFEVRGLMTAKNVDKTSALYYSAGRV